MIMEAQACSIPVVSTWHTGIPEVVRDGKSGFLAKEHDVESLAKYLKKLVNNRNLRVKMGKVGRDIILQKFNVDILNKQMCELYNKYAKYE